MHLQHIRDPACLFVSFANSVALYAVTLVQLSGVSTTNTTTTPGSDLQLDLWLHLHLFPVALCFAQAGHGAAELVAGVVAQEDVEEWVQEGV